MGWATPPTTTIEPTLWEIKEQVASYKRNANHDGKESDARLFARMGGRDDNLLLMPICFANLLEVFFFLFCQNHMDAELF
jgi:hypothetical protein